MGDAGIMIYQGAEKDPGRRLLNNAQIQGDRKK